MRAVTKYNVGGGVPEGELTRAQRARGSQMVGDYLDRVDPNMTGMGIQNTFGPIDYLLGAFPAGRVLAPAAQKLAKMFGLGSKPAQAVSTSGPMSTTIKGGFDDLVASGEMTAAEANMATRMNTQAEFFEGILNQTGDPNYAAQLTRRVYGEPAVATETMKVSARGPFGISKTNRATFDLPANSSRAQQLEMVYNELGRSPSSMSQWLKKNYPGQGRGIVMDGYKITEDGVTVLPPIQ